MSDWFFISPQLDARARRLEFAAALLRAGGLPQERATSILASELRGLVDDAEHDGDQALASVASAARDMVLAMGGAQPERSCDILMLDDNEVTRDLVVLALEAQGHQVRVASDLIVFEAEFKRRRPNVVVTGGQIKDLRPEKVASFMRQLFTGGRIPVILFANETDFALAETARRAQADRWLTKDQGISSLISELDLLLDELIW